MNSELAKAFAGKVCGKFAWVVLGSEGEGSAGVRGGRDSETETETETETERGGRWVVFRGFVVSSLKLAAANDGGIESSLHDQVSEPTAPGEVSRGRSLGSEQ